MSKICAIRYETVNTFIIGMYSDMKYSLLIPNFVTFYAKLDEI